MIFQNKLISIDMTISDSVNNYLMKVSQIHDQLVMVGEKVLDAELVNMELNGFLSSWKTFVKCIYASEKLTNLKGCRMNASKRILKWSQRPARRVVTRT
jgi:hypothetical protein